MVHFIALQYTDYTSLTSSKFLVTLFLLSSASVPALLRATTSQSGCQLQMWICRSWEEQKTFFWVQVSVTWPLTQILVGYELCYTIWFVILTLEHRGCHSMYVCTLFLTNRSWGQCCFFAATFPHKRSDVHSQVLVMASCGVEAPGCCQCYRWQNSPLVLVKFRMLLIQVGLSGLTGVEK